MLVGFLESLEFCQPVDPSVLQYTNLQQHHLIPQMIASSFPVLFSQNNQVVAPVRTKPGTLQFGWCLHCTDDYQCLSSRFLHVLLLSIAYKFSLVCRSSHYQRMCTVWKNSISWTNDDDITTVVELLDNNQVLVAMSYMEETRLKFAELRGFIITIVRHLQQEHCTSVEVCEFLISLYHVQQYHFDNLPCSTLFDIYQVARSILCQKPVILSYKDGTSRLKTQSLHFEPYHLLTTSYVCQLYPNMSNQPVPATLLHEVRKVCGHVKTKPQVYKELREYLNSLHLCWQKSSGERICM